MNWALLLPIIAQYGIPMAEKLWQKWASGQNPTQADWDELKALGRQTTKSQLILALARAGIPVDDEKAKALIALVDSLT